VHLSLLKPAEQRLRFVIIGNAQLELSLHRLRQPQRSLHSLLVALSASASASASAPSQHFDFQRRSLSCIIVGYSWQAALRGAVGVKDLEIALICAAVSGEVKPARLGAVEALAPLRTFVKLPAVM